VTIAKAWDRTLGYSCPSGIELERSSDLLRLPPLRRARVAETDVQQRPSPCDARGTVSQSYVRIESEFLNRPRQGSRVSKDSSEWG
jgi:hypothetical protein